MPTILQLDPKDFLKKATTVASHYGFTSLEDVIKGGKKIKNKNDKTKTMQVLRAPEDTFSNELINTLQTINENSILSFDRPKMFYHGNIHTKDHGKIITPRLHFGLTILGIHKGIAEALILKVAQTILDENDLKEQCIYINSIGDKDSALKFTRELSLSLRKNINTLQAQGRQALKKNIFAAVKYLQEHPCSEHKQILANIPKSMAFLSNTSRGHFTEVLEYLEATEMMYEIDDNLIENKNYYKETLFEIRSTDNADSAATNNVSSIKLAKGGRCDGIARKILRTNVSAVGILFVCNWKKRVLRSPLPKRKGRRPKYYLVQLGAKAKLQSLKMLEMLRKANIPVHQSLNEDTLGDQLQIAAELKVPYTLIIGQKEVIDNTVIVRKMDNQAQETVALDILPEYLKNMAK